jgi:hypothetical protein
MGEAARKLDPETPAARLARLRALPLSDEPLTAEEEAIFEEGDRRRAAGEPSFTTEQVLALIHEMQRDAGE